MKVTPILIPVILAASLGGWADTLWTPSFDGYLSAGRALAAGDIVYVQIDGATSLSFQAAASDAKSLTLEFSGAGTTAPRGAARTASRRASASRAAGFCSGWLGVVAVAGSAVMAPGHSLLRAF